MQPTEINEGLNLCLKSFQWLDFSAIPLWSSYTYRLLTYFQKGLDFTANKNCIQENEINKAVAITQAVF